VTPLYPQKLALTSPTGGGRSVGIARSRTKATEFSLVISTQETGVRKILAALREVQTEFLILFHEFKKINN
jgi:hypothetical protein